MWHQERELIEKLIQVAEKLEHTAKHMASALENLTAATTRLAGSVDAIVTIVNTPHPTDAQVQTAADVVNSQSDRLDAASNPATPTRTPPPAPTP